MVVKIKSSDLDAPQGVVHLNAEESEALFDAECRELLGFSADEFRHRWVSGEWAGVVDEYEHRSVLYLAIMGGLGQ